MQLCLHYDVCPSRTASGGGPWTGSLLWLSAWAPHDLYRHPRRRSRRRLPPKSTFCSPLRGMPVGRMPSAAISHRPGLHDATFLSTGRDAGAQMDRGGLVWNRFAAGLGTGLMVVGIGACSSPPPAASPQAGTLPSGTAQVTIDNKDIPRTYAVHCTSIESLRMIATGDVTAALPLSCPIKTRSPPSQSASRT